MIWHILDFCNVFIYSWSAKSWDGEGIFPYIGLGADKASLKSRESWTREHCFYQGGVLHILLVSKTLIVWEWFP